MYLTTERPQLEAQAQTHLMMMKGLKARVNKYNTQCLTYQRRIVQVVTNTQLYFATLRLLMQFISIDLIGPFDPSTDGHHYALIVIHVDRIYILCPPKTKLSEGVQAQAAKLNAKYRGSSDNGGVQKTVIYRNCYPNRLENPFHTTQTKVND